MKKIHYCWFGGGDIPPEHKEYMKTWQKHLGGCELIRHDESNFLLDCDYVREAYAAGKWAFVSDYARIKIIYEQGGIYFDTDIELLKPIDGIADTPFLAIEKKHTDIGVNLGLGFCAKKGDPVLYDCLAHYQNAHFIKSDGSFDLTTVVDRVTPILKKYGFKAEDKMQRVGSFTVYPSEYFDPVDCATGQKRFGKSTVACHHFAGSWLSKKDRLKKRVKKLLGPRVTAALISLKKRKK